MVGSVCTIRGVCAACAQGTGINLDGNVWASGAENTGMVSVWAAGAENTRMGDNVWAARAENTGTDEGL